MRIGLDFDNTIVRYDDVFQSAALARDLIPQGFSGTKQQVRDAIRLLPDGELKWQALQGHVYGKGISGAAIFPGLDGFLKRARSRGDEVVIVSHKTQFGHFDPDRVDLREAALGWMVDQAFFSDGGFGMRRENVHFASTKAEKIDRIDALDCAVFVDDLEEVLGDPAFPASVRRILFSEQASPADELPYTVCKDWPSVEEAVFLDSR